MHMMDTAKSLQGVKIVNLLCLTGICACVCVCECVFTEKPLQHLIKLCREKRVNAICVKRNHSKNEREREVERAFVQQIDKCNNCADLLNI